MSFYRNQLEKWLKKIEVDSLAVLDIGGSANPVKDRVKSFKADKYHILDNLNEETYHGKWTKPDFVVDIQEDMGFVRTYDIIFCLEVAEYLYNPLKALQNIYGLLKSGGILYMSFPTIYPVHEPVKSDCLRYTYFGICTLLNKAGFRNLVIERRVATKGINKLAKFYSMEEMRAVKRDDIIFDIGYLVKANK